MYEIIKAYRQDIGATRFIGKKYGNDDRVDGMFGAKWDEWFKNGWFGVIEKQLASNAGKAFDEADANIGLMRDDENGVFEYWIGLFTPADTAVPDGFRYMDFPKGDLGVCWVYGIEDELYAHEGECGERLEREGYKMLNGWCFERYSCPRFTTPDEKGNVILDICFFIK